MLGFVEIPKGPFLMGSDKKTDKKAEDNEIPQHEVILPAYWIGRYPVTVAQFRDFIEDDGYRPEDNKCLEGVATHPVVYVNWHDAMAYCKWLTQKLQKWPGTPGPLSTLLKKHRWRITLPSEAEWEKAARGTDGRIYPWGDKLDAERANYDDTGIGTTSAVGCFAGGKSPYGCLDMAGNVWEWTRSHHKPYPYDPADGREALDAPDSVLRVLRGGAFLRARRLRALRLPQLLLPPTSRTSSSGFGWCCPHFPLESEISGLRNSECGFRRRRPASDRAAHGQTEKEARCRPRK